MVACVFVDEFQVMLMCKLCIHMRNVYVWEMQKNNKKSCQNLSKFVTNCTELASDWPKTFLEKLGFSIGSSYQMLLVSHHLMLNAHHSMQIRDSDNIFCSEFSVRLLISLY